jgi:hypothetical protein
MLKQYVVRLAPITHLPIIVDANSLDAGRLKAVIADKPQEIGIDYFRASEPVDLEYAHKIVQEYAKRAKIGETEFSVRARLPKSFTKRKANDSNLVLAKSDEKLAQAKPGDAPKEQSLEEKVKEFHESELRIAREKKAAKEGKKQEDVDAALKPLEELAAEHGKKTASKSEAIPTTTGASSANPEGAVVKRDEVEKKRTKRAYTKSSEKERSAKSKAAYDRYVKELAAAAVQSPTIMEPVAHTATPQQYDAAVLELASALAKILKGGGIL